MSSKSSMSSLEGGTTQHLSKAVALLVLFLVVVLTGCTTRGLGPRGSSLNTTEKMMWSTYPLATDEGMATGFIVGQRDPTAPGGVLPIVLTSVHVLDTVGKGPLSMAIRVPDADGEVQIVVLQLQKTPGKLPFYTRHPRLDIGAFALRLPAEAAEIIPLPSFLDAKSLRRSNLARAGVDVSFLGFPDVAPGTSGAFPVLRSGKVASHMVGEMRTQRMFLINADVYPGDSGAPVFAKGRGGRPELIGMVSQRIGKDPKAFAHFAIAVDATAIHETVQLLMQQEAQATAGAGPAIRKAAQ